MTHIGKLTPLCWTKKLQRAIAIYRKTSASYQETKIRLELGRTEIHRSEPLFGLDLLRRVWVVGSREKKRMRINLEKERG